MKTLFTIIFALLISITTQAQLQTCDCKKDLDYTVEILKKTASYKDQIKGKKETLFNETYQNLSSQMSNPLPLEACFKLLLKQKQLILDLHQGIFFKTEMLSAEILKDSTSLKDFKNQSYYKSLPRFSKNLEELEKVLAQKPESSLEGIYKYGEIQKIGIYETENPNVYAGVIIENTLPQWEIGMIKFYATNTTANKYDFYIYNDQTLSPSVVPSLTFDNGRIWNYKAIGNENNFELSQNEEKWLFKQLTEKIQYVAFKDFSAYSTENRNAAKTFLKEHKKSFTAPYLIVDLRNNSGGSKYLSDKFLKPFEKSGATIYVITNSFTGSNGEQFASKISKIENSLHVGQTTFGILAYGIDDAPEGFTPSGNFYVQGTNMDFGNEYLKYEGRGIEPQIKLDFKTDWINQIETLINQNQ
ncbi:MAG: hypothetical protein ACSHW7_06900 [Patiriisocius sp.]|uniref:hypothetical protein n=1 Tax=Patiriisocius sp. TaxID=2822396 RepID=UPI003EF62B48